MRPETGHALRNAGVHQPQSGKTLSPGNLPATGWAATLHGSR